jgi:MFS family permease
LLDYEIVTDRAVVGSYAGLIESQVFLCEALFILQLCRLSDRIGRKPLLVIGAAGQALTALSFGFSKTFLTMLISRAAVGCVNANTGVMKAVLAEVTDGSNRARAFVINPLGWACGLVLGPLIGGTVASYKSQYTQHSAFLRNWPYFLPCAVAAAFPAAACIFNVLFFKETLNKQVKTDYLLLEAQPEAPILTVRQLLKMRRVRNAILAYNLLALMDLAVLSILPVYMYLPILGGGLGFQPSRIGLVLASSGMFAALGALFLAPYAQKRIGSSSL